MKALSYGIALALLSPLAHADIKISEVMYDAPNNDSTEEFVELFNTGCSSVSLSGYSLKDNGGSFALTGTLGAGQYALIAKDGTAFTNLTGKTATQTGLTLALGNSGDYVQLLQNGSMVDQVGWENGLSGWSVAATNVSLVRQAATDSDSQADWTAASNVHTAGSSPLTADCGGTTTPPSGSNTNLTLGVTQNNLAGASKSETLYSLNLANSASSLTFTLNGGSGDADLFVKAGSTVSKTSYDCKSENNNSNETCTLTNVPAGQYNVLVYGYSAYSGVSLVANATSTTPTPTPTTSVLVRGEAVTGLNQTSGNVLNFTFTPTTAVTNLTFTISGGNGDADLYVKAGAMPTSSSYDCRPYKTGNEESCSFANASTTTYYVQLQAYSSFSGLTLVANHDVSSTPTDPTPPPSGNFDFNTYYQNAIGKTGTSLRLALNSAIQTTTRLTYSQVWEAIKYTDEDPNNTNNVILIYSGRSQDKNDNAGNNGNTADSWNREHVWAKSHGFPNESQWAYTDIHHLRPADASINSTRSNKDFDNGGTPLTEAPENKTDSDSFEPRNAVKGDVARMMFYMDIRYEGGDQTGVPDLIIPDYTGTANGSAELGKLCTLLAWHHADPVDAWEQRRNNRAYEKQGNRNPFIDYPQWADELYQSRCQ